MRGQLIGVQKRIRDKAPFVYNVHCYRYRLNLVLINATKHVPGSANFFRLLENLYIFVNNPVVYGKISWNTTRNVFWRTSPRDATSQWYTMLVSGYIVRKCSVLAGSHHRTLGGDICKWNRNSCYISKMDAEFVHLLGGGSDILEQVYKVSLKPMGYTFF